MPPPAPAKHSSTTGRQAHPHLQPEGIDSAILSRLSLDITTRLACYITVRSGKDSRRFRVLQHGVDRAAYALRSAKTVHGFLTVAPTTHFPSSVLCTLVCDCWQAQK